MAAPGRKFSWMRLVNNVIPNMANDDPNDVDLSPVQADKLFKHQVSQTYPRYLAENSFFVAGLVDSESMSKKVHKALVKNKIILLMPEMSESGSGTQGTERFTVNTVGITKKFASQLAIISVHSQRKLVGMLFFWEAECMRWNLLDAEKEEIISVIDTKAENKDLSIALDAVEMKKKLLPSERGESTPNVGEGRGYQLPVYS